MVLLKYSMLSSKMGYDKCMKQHENLCIVIKCHEMHICMFAHSHTVPLINQLCCIMTREFQFNLFFRILLSFIFLLLPFFLAPLGIFKCIDFFSINLPRAKLYCTHFVSFITNIFKSIKKQHSNCHGFKCD